jgi:hypothetical protein
MEDADDEMLINDPNYLRVLDEVKVHLVTKPDESAEMTRTAPI